MPKMTETTASPIKHVLVYGPPKTGKSELVGKLSEKMKLVWLDIEFGSDVLYKLPREWQENITIVKIPDSKAFPMGYQTIVKLFTAGKGSICVKHGAFNCPLCKKESAPVDEINFADFDQDTVLVIDSWSQIVLSIIGIVTKNKPDDYKMDRDEWMHVKQAVENLATMIQAAPFHVVVISHDEMVEQLDKSAKIVPVGGSRNTSRNFAKYFGEVIYSQVLNKKHKFSSSTVASNNIITGSRSDTVMEKSDDPKLLTVFGK